MSVLHVGWSEGLTRLPNLVPEWRDACHYANTQNEGPRGRGVVFRYENLIFLAQVTSPTIWLYRPTSCCNRFPTGLRGLTVPEDYSACSACNTVPPETVWAGWTQRSSPRYTFDQVLEEWLGEGRDVLSAAILLHDLRARIERVFKAKVLAPEPGQTSPEFDRVLARASGPLR